MMELVIVTYNGTPHYLRGIMLKEEAEEALTQVADKTDGNIVMLTREQVQDILDGFDEE